MMASPGPRVGAFPPPTPVANRTTRPPSTAGPSPPKSGSLPMAPMHDHQHVILGPGPRIPLNVMDAPAQRFWALSVWCALWAYKLYDWIQLYETNTDGVWLFLKWLFIDFAFIFGLPELRIPWLELSQFAAVVVFTAHFVVDYLLMFKVAIPFGTALLGLVKVFYDRETSISERQVKMSDILHNDILISGKQIINILPEGSAIMNPEHTPFCVGGDQTTASIPIHFNSTVPIEVEMTRIDLDTRQEETIKLPRSAIREISKQAKRQADDEHGFVVTYYVPVKKHGVYRLAKVLDEYKLEVQRTSADTFVVPCPQARVAHATSSSRCLGELSNLALHVDGTPPLKIVYSRTINGKDHSFHFQSLQPDGFSSPLLGRSFGSDADDVFWARSQRVVVALNESMTIAGSWQYSVDEVHDAFGNVVKYSSDADEVDPNPRPKPKHLVQDFVVKERPRVALSGCKVGNPLKVAKGKSTTLPIKFDIPGKTPADTSHTVTWHFSPMDSLTKGGDHGDVVYTETYTAKNRHDKPSISHPGLYTLKSVTCDSCEGEVQEPSSCLLINPLEPQLSIRTEDIPDPCTGTSAGLSLNMDLVGTPPFKVRYEVAVTHLDGRKERRLQKIDIPGLRHHMKLEPTDPGHYQFTFKQIDDSVYKGIPLSGDNIDLETNLKPTTSARFVVQNDARSACLEDVANAAVELQGEAPFTLEYELIHDGKRKQEKITGIESKSYTIKTPKLLEGGEYSLVLTSVKDRTGCRKIPDKQESKISVRRHRPRAAFGLIESKRKVMTVSNSMVKIPVRLTGASPWTVTLRTPDSYDAPQKLTLTSENSVITVKSKGVYELLDIYDGECHGSVDPKANTFEVGWVPRPELSILSTESISPSDGGFSKQAVCEGDIDGFDVKLQGSAPFHVEYEVRHKPIKGGESIARRSFDAVLGKATIQMDTGKAGTYTYKFKDLSDNMYSTGPNIQPVVLQQKVNPKPSASFVKPGQTFKYCTDQSETEDLIPIHLTGAAPFSIEIEVKHQAGTQAETYTIPSIDSTEHGLRIPRKFLKLGSQHIRIRSVRDSRGCSSKADSAAVQVQLFDAPSIYPLESRSDYCIGEHISYTLSGTPPFDVYYTFEGHAHRATSKSTTLKRVAESPGVFTINSLSDRASECRAGVNITKVIHPMPTVRISRGKSVQVDIHEGSEVEILFEFTGTPPFEFTYTRSSNAKKGQRSQVLETRHEVSYEHEKRVMASLEGTYEVIAIKDKYCAFSSRELRAERMK